MRNPKWIGFSICCILLQIAIVASLDYITSYEVSVAIFYYIPIAFAAWSLGATSSVVVGILCAITLTWMEIAAGRHYSHEWIVVERAFVRMLAFTFVAYSFNSIRSNLIHKKNQIRRLKELFVICNGCHRIKDGEGDWIDFDSLMDEKSTGDCVPKLCPTCARQVYANKANIKMSS